MATRTLRLLAGLGLALTASTAEAQTIDFNFDVSDGGWTASTLSGTQNWFWDAGNAGWRVNQSSSVGQTRLLSPLLRATTGFGSVTMQHRYNFEPSASACFDGGNWKLDVGGAGFFVGEWVSGGYRGPISANFSNPMAGQNAWCGTSNGWAAGDFVEALASGGLTVGATYRFAFDAGWDSSVGTTAPNWEIGGIVLEGFEIVQEVPEPTSLALLFGGLLAVGAAGRRRA